MAERFNFRLGRLAHDPFPNYHIRTFDCLGNCYSNSCMESRPVLLSLTKDYQDNSLVSFLFSDWLLTLACDILAPARQKVRTNNNDVLGTFLAYLHLPYHNDKKHIVALAFRHPRECFFLPAEDEKEKPPHHGRRENAFFRTKTHSTQQPTFRYVCRIS